MSIYIYKVFNTTVVPTDLGLVYLNKISDIQETCILSKFLDHPYVCVSIHLVKFKPRLVNILYLYYIMY